MKFEYNIRAEKNASTINKTVLNYEWRSNKHTWQIYAASTKNPTNSPKNINQWHTHNQLPVLQTYPNIMTERDKILNFSTTCLWQVSSFFNDLSYILKLCVVHQMRQKKIQTVLTIRIDKGISGAQKRNYYKTKTQQRLTR